MGAFRFSWLAGLIFLAVLIGASSLPRRAQAQQPVYKTPSLTVEKGKLLVSCGFREMFDSRLREKLRSGFATTIVMRVYLYPSQGGNPLTVSGRTIRVVYDLWEEKYSFQEESPAGTNKFFLRDQNAVVDGVTSLWRFPVADLTSLGPKQQYFVAVAAEVNPISEELLREVQRWLRNPRGEHQSAGGSSIFGSFVSIFVNKRVSRAEKSFNVRTLLFTPRP